MASRFPRYELLLNFYPKSYREEYARQMTQTLADMLDDTISMRQKITIWAKVAVDLPVSVAKSQFQYAGGIIRNETPKYIKQVSLLCILLLVPFFAALIANSLDKIVNNHTLYNSWLWHSPALAVWVLWLPATALALALLSYTAYVVVRSKGNTSTSWLKRVLDIRHAWLVMVPAIIALGILFILAFHDSAHCWTQNPVHFVTHWHQIWQCTSRSFLGN